MTDRQGEDGARPQGPTEQRRGRIVRRPRMLPFLLTGAVLGAALGTLLALLRPTAPAAGPAQEVILVGGSGLLLGGLLAAVVFIVVERASQG